MRKIYVRLPLEVEPELATEIDAVLAAMTLKAGLRITRTAFIKEAIQEKLASIKKELDGS
jgi:hypothetical protein